MHLDAAALRDRDRSLAAEWLIADGAGGYASSTPLLCGTRRYHGLWVPAMRPPVDRRVVLSHIDERIQTDGVETFLSTTEYGSGFFPDGSPAAESFDSEPLPRLVSSAGGTTVQREVVLLRDGAGVCIVYRVRSEKHWTLALSPMLALRSMHHLVHRHDAFRVEELAAAGGFRVITEGLPGVFLWLDMPGGKGAKSVEVSAETGPLWYFGVLRRVERERGFDHFEDLLTPGRWTISGTGPAEWRLACSFEPPRKIDVGAELRSLITRRADLAVRAGAEMDQRLSRLAVAADAFIVRRRVGTEDLATVIAGYHWFGDWGRDTLIALPGLAMETGRLDVAEKILRAFAGRTPDGLVPNCYDENTGQAQYNTVDASLWFLQATAAFARAGGSERFVREELWPAACQISERYRRGTAFGIHADSDGLITAGSPETQLTWMDATSRGRPVTPRYGKAVEINALWISGLGEMQELASRLRLAPPPAAADLERTSRAFANLFWNPERRCLYDCVFPDGRRDPSVRPNQIFAVGLPHAPLSGEQAKAVVQTVREKLLTPRGLRTLAPDDPAYRGRYAGGPDERDAAYHQGTVWPWLLGPYVDASFAVEDQRCARGEARQILGGLLDSMDEAGLGYISEIFDGDPPHRPGGCIAQAWSVAAAIHIWKCLALTGGLT